MAQSCPKDPDPVDLTKCGICKDTITDPRALQCLHTFCLECLREWVQQSKETVMCPVTGCNKNVRLPPDGVDGLPGNVIVSSLMKRSLPHPTKTQACSCCEEDAAVLLARCIDCNGFLCQKGIDLHKTFVAVKDHQVISINDLKYGKIDVGKISKPPNCSKHKDQILWLFCETCGVVICRDCTVLDHSQPEHKYVDLKSMTVRQKERIRQLYEQSEVVAHHISVDFEQLTTTQRDMDTTVTQVSLKIDNAADMLTKYIDIIRKTQQQQLKDLVNQSSKVISQTIEGLNSQNVRLRAAQTMAKQVLSTGSDCDVASVYSQLTTSFQDLGQRQAMIQRDAAYEVQFSENTNLSGLISTLGKLSLGSVPVSTRGTWVHEGTIDINGSLLYLHGIAITLDGNIAVPGCTKSLPINVFTPDGQFKFSLDNLSVDAWAIAVALNGHLFITTYDCKYVKEYNPEGQYRNQFPTVSPNGVSSLDTQQVLLRGVAISTDGNVLVGECSDNYISIHNTSGKPINSIRVNIQPCFIAVTRDNHIVVSSWFGLFSEGIIHVIDLDGQQLYAVGAPQAVSNWIPAGICTTINNEIYIANGGNGAQGIYSFTSDGEYLGCITKDVVNPAGIAHTVNGDWMAVVENSDKCVKIFKHKY